MILSDFLCLSLMNVSQTYHLLVVLFAPIVYSLHKPSLSFIKESITAWSNHFITRSKAVVTWFVVFGQPVQKIGVLYVFICMFLFLYRFLDKV